MMTPTVCLFCYEIAAPVGLVNVTLDSDSQEILEPDPKHLNPSPKPISHNILSIKSIASVCLCFGVPAWR